jgi:hypothetical protein
LAAHHPLVDDEREIRLGPNSDYEEDPGDMLSELDTDDDSESPMLKMLEAYSSVNPATAGTQIYNSNFLKLSHTIFCREFCSAPSCYYPGCTLEET